jgi:hypothetical protein
MVDSFLRANVADVDHAFNAFAYHKGAEFCQTYDEPSTVDPSGNFCAAFAQGSPSA